MEPEGFTQISERDLKFRSPASFIFYGSSGCGKTTKLVEMISKLPDIFDEVPQKIVMIYSLWQPLYDSIKELRPDTIFLPNIPSDFEDYFDPSYHSLAIIDDQMSTLATDKSKAKKITDLFCKTSHHLRVSCFLLLQSIFPKEPCFRIMSTNAQNLIIFKNMRDSNSFRVLARQITPLRWKRLVRAFEDCTKTPYNPLIISLHPETRESLRFRNGLDQNAIFYQI